MKKTNIQSMPHFFDRYINLVEDMDVVAALEKYDALEQSINLETLQKLADLRYAPEKWTVKDIIQHITDNERIQSYRALRFARSDKSSLPGYDEQAFAASAQETIHERTINDLLEEFRVLRNASILLYKSFSAEMLQREGVACNSTISVLALGFVLVGHQIHHINIIKERYLPLLIG